MRKRYVIYLICPKEKTIQGDYGHADNVTMHRFQYHSDHESLEEAEATIAKEIQHETEWNHRWYTISTIYGKTRP